MNDNVLLDILVAMLFPAAMMCVVLFLAHLERPRPLPRAARRIPTRRVG